MTIIWLLLVVLLIVGASGLWRLFCVGDIFPPDDDDDEDPPLGIG